MPSSADDIDIAALWSAVTRNKWRLALAVIVVGAATFLALSFVTPRYASEAQILIENDESAFTRPRGAPGTVDAGRIDREAVESQVHVLASPDLAEKVVEKLDLAKVPEFNHALEPASLWSRIADLLDVFSSARPASEQERVLEAFAKRLVVYAIKDSRVITVAFTSRDPERAARIANTLAETYLEWQRAEQLKTNRGASKWLGERIATLRREMEEAEARVEKFRASAGLMAGQNNVTLNTQQLSELQSQLSIARAARSEAEARAKLIRAMLDRGDIEASPDVLKSVLIQRLLEQKVRVERQIAELSATLLPAHPRLRQLRADLAGLRRQLRAEAAKVVRSLENEAKIAKAREASLEASLNRLKGRATGTSDALARLRVLEREAKSKRELYEAFLARHGEASARQNRFSVPSYASIIQRARPASEPSFPKRGALSVLAMVGTLLVGLAFIVTRELLRGAARPQAPAGAWRMAEPAPLAMPETPASGSGGDRGPRMSGDPAGPEEAQSGPTLSAGVAQAAGGRVFSDPALLARHMRAIRQSGKPGIALIAGAGEESSAGDALTLARRMAADGAAVVLLDGSGGHGGLARGLGLLGRAGLMELVEGTADFGDVIARDAQSGVQIIPFGGQGTGFGAGEGALSSQSETRLRLVFEALREAYDEVLIHVASPDEAERLLTAIGSEADRLVIVADGTAEGAARGEALAQAHPDLTVLLYRRAGRQAPSMAGRRALRTGAFSAGRPA